MVSLLGSGSAQGWVMFRSASLTSFAPILLLSAVSPPPALGQKPISPLDQIQIAPPMRQVQPPSPTASVEELEKQGDELRGQKAYLDAIDYFRAALAKAPDNASVIHKIGISDLY